MFCMDVLSVGLVMAPQRADDRVRSTSAWWMNKNCAKSKAPMSMKAKATKMSPLSMNTAPLRLFRPILLRSMEFSSSIGRIDAQIGISEDGLGVERGLRPDRV